MKGDRFFNEMQRELKEMTMNTIRYGNRNFLFLNFCFLCILYIYILFLIIYYSDWNLNYLNLSRNFYFFFYKSMNSHSAVCIFFHRISFRFLATKGLKEEFFFFCCKFKPWNKLEKCEKGKKTEKVRKMQDLKPYT